MTIDGNIISGCSQPSYILPPGTIIGSLTTSGVLNPFPGLSTISLKIDGYLATAYYTPVLHNLKASSYTVPSGKTLYLTSIIDCENTNPTNVLIDGVAVNYLAIRQGDIYEHYFVVNSGSVISVTTSSLSFHINGVLK